MAKTEKTQVVTARAWNVSKGTVEPGTPVADIELHEIDVNQGENFMPTPRTLADGLSNGMFMVKPVAAPKKESKPTVVDE